MRSPPDVPLFLPEQNPYANHLLLMAKAAANVIGDVLKASGKPLSASPTLVALVAAIEDYENHEKKKE